MFFELLTIYLVGACVAAALGKILLDDRDTATGCAIFWPITFPIYMVAIVVDLTPTLDEIKAKFKKDQ